MKQKSEEEYVQMDDAAWAPFPEALSTGGITWRLLHVSPDMGSWTAVFECPEGSSFNAHFHTGPGEYFLYKGRTRQTVTAITTAAGVGIGLAVARISVALNPWLILAVMVIVWLYVVTIAWSGWHFILVQRGLRQQWQTKLFRFLSAGDYDAMVTTPVGRSETVFKRTAISGVGVLAAWVACVVVFAFLAAPNSPTAPKPDPPSESPAGNILEPGTPQERSQPSAPIIDYFQGEWAFRMCPDSKVEGAVWQKNRPKLLSSS